MVTPLASTVMLLAPTVSVIFCPAVMELEPAVTEMEWSPWLTVSVSLPTDTVAAFLPWLTVSSLSPWLTVTDRLPLLIVVLLSWVIVTVSLLRTVLV